MNRATGSVLKPFLLCLALGACNVPAPPAGPLPLALRSAARVSPDANRGALLYVTAADNRTYVVSLPSGKLVSTLLVYRNPRGACSDASGDVFIVAQKGSRSEIREYKHGAKNPFNVLSDEHYTGTGCSVDPATGNLAVANCCAGRHHAFHADGSVAIYAHAKGQPKYYKDPELYADWFCTYDSHGNLFVDGYDGAEHFELEELPAGKPTLKPLTLHPKQNGDYTPVFWDGAYLAIASLDSGAINEYVVGGSQATRVHVIKLAGVSRIGSFWVAGDGNSQTLYAPIGEGGVVGVYRYPAGGKPIGDIDDVNFADGVTVSTAPH